MQKVLTILNKLVGFQTDGNRDNHQKCLAYIEDYIKSECRHSIIEHIPTNGMDNLIIGLNVEKLQNIQCGLMLCGHLDVVTGRSEQFLPVQKDDKIFGRGTTDMKGAVACFLSLAAYFETLNMPVIMCFTCDEETDILGIQDICTFLKNNNIRTLLTILGEPTENKLGIRSSGINSYKTVVKGVAAHSSVPQQGVSAIFAAAHILQQLEQVAQKMLPKELYLNVGHITGGGNLTKIPDNAEIDWGFRYMHKIDAEEVMQKYRQIESEVLAQYPQAHIQTTQTEDFLEFTATDDDLTAEICRLLHIETGKFAYTSEAGYLAQIGQKAHLFGPSSIKLAHTDNEYIILDDLKTYRTQLMSLVEYISVKK
ncbi:MAG: M20/M25/M40 family metallo-hydrolase [Alphaproteobacteria bacterium]